MTHTIRLHRVLTAPPERVWRAFLEPEAWVRWLPPFGYTAKLHEHDPQVGGAWRMHFTHFASGHVHAFGGRYLELQPHEVLAYDARFDDPNLPGTMVTRVQLRAVSCGTEIEIEQSGLPEVIPPEQCYLGWQESLLSLKQLVEPAIPG